MMSLRDRKIRAEPAKLQTTSMIDVVFLLLAFFVVTFKTPQIEGDFNIKMPVDAESNAMPTPDPILPVQVRLVAGPNRTLSGIFFGSKPLGTDMRALRTALFEYLQIDPTQQGAAQGGGGVPRDDIRDELEIELDCDYDLDYRYTMQAITAVTGYINAENQVVRLVDKVKFTPPDAE